MTGGRRHVGRPLAPSSLQLAPMEAKVSLNGRKDHPGCENVL